MHSNSYFLFVFIVLFSCNKKDESLKFRTNFSDKEKKIIQTADAVIKSAYYTTLITLDKDLQPRARIVEPFLPEKNHIIWIATNPKSRKVKQLKNNATATLHYFDKNKLAYVSLMGNAYLVNNDSIKKVKWKKGWEKFYPNRKKDYLLLKFVPKYLELISISDNYTGDKNTWQPDKVILRK
jgi:general stress protein 26